MSTGPTTQFWISETSSTFQSRNTSGSFSYRTFANGGYIIKIKPIAIGIFVVPTETRSNASAIPGTAYPASTPIPIARKIQSVKNRSRKPSRFDCVPTQGPAAACSSV